MDREHSVGKMEESKVGERSGSTGIIVEMWRRKREREGEEGGDEEGKEIFKRSKKTPRSPVEMKNMPE